MKPGKYPPGVVLGSGFAGLVIHVYNILHNDAWAHRLAWLGYLFSPSHRHGFCPAKDGAVPTHRVLSMLTCDYRDAKPSKDCASTDHAMGNDVVVVATGKSMTNR